MSKNNDFAKAQAEYRSALAQDPDNSFWLAMLARADARTGNKSAARRTLRDRKTLTTPAAIRRANFPWP